MRTISPESRERASVEGGVIVPSLRLAVPARQGPTGATPPRARARGEPSQGADGREAAWLQMAPPPPGRPRARREIHLIAPPSIGAKLPASRRI